MYSRELDGEVRSFGVSGKLWHGVLVMFDREGDSLWTQLDGRAIQGEELGSKLEHVPSTYTTWERWREAHPDTLVLEKSGEDLERVGSHYADYFADPDRLFMDHLGDGLGGISPKDVVFGVVLGDSTLAVSEDLLTREGVVNAVVAGRPVGFVRNASTGAALAVDRRLGERVLVLERYGSEDPSQLFRDALTGEVHGVDELEPLRIDRAFWYAWKRTHKESGILAD